MSVRLTDGMSIREIEIKYGHGTEYVEEFTCKECGKKVLRVKQSGKPAMSAHFCGPGTMMDMIRKAEKK